MIACKNINLTGKVDTQIGGRKESNIIKTVKHQSTKMNKKVIIDKSRKEDGGLVEGGGWWKGIFFSCSTPEDSSCRSIASQQGG